MPLFKFEGHLSKSRLALQRAWGAMEELELVKENVLPLRRGRAVPAAGLAGAEGLDRPRAAKLEEERRCAPLRRRFASPLRRRRA